MFPCSTDLFLFNQAFVNWDLEIFLTDYFFANDWIYIFSVGDFGLDFDLDFDGVDFLEDE